MFCLLVVLAKLSLLAKWLARKTPPRKPNRGKGIISIKPRPKSVHDFLGLLYCFIVLLCICVVFCPYVIYYPTVVSRYSLFVLKVPLIPKQTKPWARRWRTTNVCDVWPVRRQTYGYLPSCKAPPIRWYQIILLGDRGTCVNNLPRVALDGGAAGIRTRDLLIASPALYRSPPSHTRAPGI